MRLVTYNVEYCAGINRTWKYLEVQKYFKLVKKTLMKIVDYLKDVNPDILALIEIDAGTVTFRKKSGVEMFSDELGMNYFAAKTKYPKKSVYKVLNHVPVFRKHANAILSKYPLFDIRYYFLSKGMKRLVIQSKLKFAVEGKVIDLFLFAVHLSLRKKTRQIQLKELGQLINACDGEKMVFGDFNNFAGYKEFSEFLGETNMVNAIKASKEPHITTFPSWKPRRHLDHVLVTKGIKVNDYRVLDAKFSDHLPVLVDFELE
ncbi:MAG: endonuclease/exonuclease/phosphatase family protein [archaeon]